MGNQLSANYDIKQKITRVGPSACWQVKAAIVKKTEKPCSLFFWSKKDFHEFVGVGSGEMITFGRDKEHAQNDILWFEKTLEFEVKQLSKLRYPNILKVMDPLVSTDHFMAFTTEPIIWNLHDLLVSSTSSIASNTTKLVQDFDLHLDEVDIQAGLIQIGKALEFLHKNQILHLCLTPECIFIDEKGDWKLAGFTYSRKVGSNSPIDSPSYTMPSLAYFAPEVLLYSSATILSDSFSFGSLIYSIFNSSKPFSNTSSISLYIDEVKKGVNVNMLPLSLQYKVKEMLSFDITFRPELETLLTSDYFNNNLIGTLKMIAGLMESTPVEKARFLKHLPTLLQQFPLKTVVKKVLPCLLDELKNPEIAAFVLPNLFWIGERLSVDEFTSKILPSLRAHVWIERDPPLTLLLLLSRMDLLVSKVKESEFEAIGELICSSLSSKNAQVSTSACKSIPLASSKITKQFLLISMIPLLISLFQECRSIQIQGYCLISLRSFLSILGREGDGEQVILNTIFKSFLDRLSQPPEELILLIGVIYYECGLTWFSANVNSLKKQYGLVMKYIEEIGKKVRDERIATLADISEKVELQNFVADSKNTTPYSKEKLVPINLVATPSYSPEKALINNETALFYAKLDQRLSLTSNSTPTEYSTFTNGAVTATTSRINSAMHHPSSSSSVAKKLDWSEFDPL